MDATLSVTDLRVAVFDQWRLTPGLWSQAPTGSALPEGWREALSACSFEVAAGETLVVMGPAGSGKSLLLSGALSLLPVWARIVGGRVQLGAETLWPTPRMSRDDGLEDSNPGPYFEASLDPEWRKTMRRRIGVVFQEPMLSNERQTVAAFVREGLPRGRWGSRLARVGELLRLGDQLTSGDRRMYELSPGEQQRVTLAIALAKSPALFVADEPFSAIDASTTADIADFVKTECAERGMAALVATNDPGLAAMIADRTIVMESGRIVSTEVAGSVHPAG